MSAPESSDGYVYADEGKSAEERHRSAVHALESKVDELRAARSARRLHYLWLIASIVAVVLLGYSGALAFWQADPDSLRVIGLISVVLSTVGASYTLVKKRPALVDLNFEARQLLHVKHSLAAKVPVDSVEALRIYRESSLDLVEQFRRNATRNRGVHNAFQGFVIAGSIMGSTMTALVGELPDIRWYATVVTALVSISAGLTGYFKFRERGYNEQSTADDIERHYNAVQFRIGEYQLAGGESEEEAEKIRLRKFAENVEKLKEEQRKRELQLEQSPGASEERT
ncbi:SLATT domain-containing protein [Actinokineospora guangxiensis]|uniref:SLATT domain-containing protein n=1 Tax=Actinokineospora guangxiensis TaxID=1490288 RepID=A0ABW0EWH9_9PSEU